MRVYASLAVLIMLPALLPAADKLTFDDRVELTRGLTAEYGKMKILLPHSKKALEVESDGTYNKKAWSDEAKESGPAARLGDTVQVTKVDIDDDRIVLQINGGYKGGRKWYQGVQIGVNNGQSVPIARGGDSNAPGGTSIAVMFRKGLEPIKAAEVKKILAPVIDFEKRTVTEIYSETLPPEVQSAIKENRALEGMNHDQVVMALGRPVYKSRETKDGMDLEDWVYGHAPGKITFVTFNGDKVIKVKEAYAGLGTQVQDPVIKQ